MNAYEIPNLQFSLKVKTDIARYRFVTVDADGYAVQATGTEPVIGVSREAWVEADYPEAEPAIPIADGILMVESSAVIASGTQIISDANGMAAAATDPATEVVCGVAITNSTAAGALIAVKVKS